jgi:hypothetical protein
LTQAPADTLVALMARSGAGSGPRSGTRMAFMHPSSIAFLAIVIVMSGRRRDRPPLRRRLRETGPQHVPVPRARRRFERDPHERTSFAEVGYGR